MFYWPLPFLKTFLSYQILVSQFTDVYELTCKWFYACYIKWACVQKLNTKMTEFLIYVKLIIKNILTKDNRNSCFPFTVKVISNLILVAKFYTLLILFAIQCMRYNKTSCWKMLSIYKICFVKTRYSKILH